MLVCCVVCVFVCVRHSRTAEHAASTSIYSAKYKAAFSASYEGSPPGRAGGMDQEQWAKARVRHWERDVLAEYGDEGSPLMMVDKYACYYWYLGTLSQMPTELELGRYRCSRQAAYLTQG